MVGIKTIRPLELGKREFVVPRVKQIETTQHEVGTTTRLVQLQCLVHVQSCESESFVRVVGTSVSPLIKMEEAKVQPPGIPKTLTPLVL